MSWWPLFDQRKLTPDGAEDCFETCLAMALQHLGHNVSPEEILAVHAGPTDLPTALSLCVHFNLKGCSITRGPFDNADKLAIALFRDDANAQPNAAGPNEHYCVVPSQTATTVELVNPWGGIDEPAVPQSKFNPAYEGAIIVPVAENTVGGTDMANLGAGFFQGVAVGLSAGLLQRTREGDGTAGSNVDAAVAGALLANPDSLIEQVHAITQSTEFKNLQAMSVWLEHNLTDGQGNVVPAKLAAALGAAGAGATVQQVEQDIAHKLQ